MIMEWKEVRLEHLADVQTGPFGSQLHNEDYVLNGTPIVTVEHLGNKTFTRQNLPMVSDEDKYRLNKYVAIEGDIIFSRVGSVDRCSYVDKETSGWLFSGRCLRVRANSELYPEYLYYYFNREEVKQYIRNIAVGATMPSINTKLLNEVPILYPNYVQQKRIADILSSLDAKIENNNKINAKLEEMAQALFKSWFIDFEPFKVGRDGSRPAFGSGNFVESELGMIPEGWKVRKLGDLIKTTSGGTPSRKIESFYEKGTICWVKSKELAGSFIIDTEEKITNEAVEKSSAKKLPEFSVLIAMYGATVGEYAIIDKEMTCNQAICALLPNDDIPYSFLYMLAKNKKEDLINKAVGSAQQNISQVIVKDLDIVYDLSIIRRFHQIVKPIFNKILGIIKENRNLAQTRDTLLPKLMSGEIEL